MCEYVIPAACIGITLRKIIHNRCGCVRPLRLVSKTRCILIYICVMHPDIQLSGLLPRFASISSCVYIYTADVDALLLAACIMDKLHLIYFAVFSSRVATPEVHWVLSPTNMLWVGRQMCRHTADDSKGPRRHRGTKHLVCEHPIYM